MDTNINNTMESGEALAENKLIILYLMNRVNCTLSNLQILKLLYDFEGFNYYYFQHILSDLVEKKYIMSYKQNEEWLYEITALGTEVLELTEGKGLFFLIERNFELVLGNVALLTLDDLIFCDDVI